MDKLSWIGSLCVALFFILGPINNVVIRVMGYRWMLLTGTVLCTAALILASFAKEARCTYRKSFRSQRCIDGDN